MVDVSSGMRSWLGSLADRLGIAPVTVVVGGAAVAAAALGGWWAFAAPDPPVAEDVLPRLGTPAMPAPASGPSSVPAPQTVVVHVDGAVLAPGVHELAAGSRVVDAITAAEGLRADADQARLNLAAPVGDGQRIWVPVIGEEEPVPVAPTGGGPGDGEVAAGPIDLNTADVAALETLPGIGPSIAGAIIAHRDERGRFGSVGDLLEVPGIGPTRLAQLEPLVRV